MRPMLPGAAAFQMGTVRHLRLGQMLQERRAPPLRSTLTAS
jgi:hypothetical protein